MARKKTAETKKVSNSVIIPKESSIIELDLVLNKSYVIDNPLQGLKTTLTIQLNGKTIDNSIRVMHKEYAGITAAIKGTSILIFTGKHSLCKNDKIIEGHLVLQIAEI